MATANMTADQGFLYVKSENSEHSHNHHLHHGHKSGHKRPRIEPLPAAATNDGNSSSSSSSDSPSTPELMRCKRRINFAQMGYNLPQAPPAAVARRNERERNRVKLVNMGFATLREHVPNGVKNKKMSKVETLRSAVDYIKRLQELLDEQNPGGSSSGSAAAAAAAALAGLADTFASDGSTTGDGEGCYNNGSGGGGGDAGRVNGDGASSTVNGSATGGNICLPSSVSPTCSVASSPTPSYTSDCSSYEPLSPEEEDLLDFTTWFS